MRQPLRQKIIDAANKLLPFKKQAEKEVSFGPSKNPAKQVAPSFTNTEYSQSESMASEDLVRVLQDKHQTIISKLQKLKAGH